jgi:hypothetical protein
MGDNRVAVLGDLDVEFERADTHFEAAGERGDGALDGEAESAAVGLDVEVAAPSRISRYGDQTLGEQTGNEGKRNEGAREAAHGRSLSSVGGPDAG